MTYVPKNTDVLLRAFAGMIGAIETGRYIVDDVPGDYSHIVNVAGAFAEEFDTRYDIAYAGELPTEFRLLAIESLCTTVLQGRYPNQDPSSVTPATYALTCNAIIAILKEGDAWIGSNIPGITTGFPNIFVTPDPFTAVSIAAYDPAQIGNTYPLRTSWNLILANATVDSTLSLSRTLAPQPCAVLEVCNVGTNPIEVSDDHAGVLGTVPAASGSTPGFAKFVCKPTGGWILWEAGASGAGGLAYFYYPDTLTPFDGVTDLTFDAPGAGEFQIVDNAWNALTIAAVDPDNQWHLPPGIDVPITIGTIVQFLNSGIASIAVVDEVAALNTDVPPGSALRCYRNSNLTGEDANNWRYEVVDLGFSGLDLTTPETDVDVSLSYSSSSPANPGEFILFGTFNAVDLNPTVDPINCNLPDISEVASPPFAIVMIANRGTEDVTVNNSTQSFTLPGTLNPLQPSWGWFARSGYTTDYEVKSIFVSATGSVIIEDGGSTASNIRAAKTNGGQPIDNTKNGIVAFGSRTVGVTTIAAAYSTCIGGDQNGIVAGADYTCIGGANNLQTAATPGAVIYGINNTCASRAYVIGISNSVNGTSGDAVCMGFSNTCTGATNGVCIGGGNTCSADDTTAIGVANVASAVGASAVGGRNNTASGLDSHTAGGQFNSAVGAGSHASGRNAEALRIQERSHSFTLNGPTGAIQDTEIGPYNTTPGLAVGETCDVKINGPAGAELALQDNHFYKARFNWIAVSHDGAQRASGAIVAMLACMGGTAAIDDQNPVADEAMAAGGDSGDWTFTLTAPGGTTIRGEFSTGTTQHDCVVACEVQFAPQLVRTLT